MEELTGQAEPWRLADTLLEIREGEVKEADTHLVDLYEAEWNELGFQVVRPLEAVEHTWRMSVDRWVGVARLPEREGHRPQLRIKPKMDADVFFLADYAFGKERNRIAELQLDAVVASTREEPAAHLIAWLLAELETFILRHLRRDYIIQRETFEGRIRGRLMMSEYLQRYVASGQSHRAPCQFFEFTRDNLANQILKRSLRELRRLTSLLPLPAARRELGDWADRLLPYLGAVSDCEIHDADFNRLRLRASMRHYKPIMAKCRSLLGRTYMTTALGPHVQDAFLWNMPALFEGALRGILRTTATIRLERRGGEARIADANGKLMRTTHVWPDFLLKTDGGPIILDAKYKETGVAAETSDPLIEVEVPGAESIRIRHSDIYQAIAYGQHDTYRPASVGLIYPIVLGADESLPFPYRVDGFSEDLWLFFLDVGEHARDNLENFRAILLDVAGAPATPMGAAGQFS